jgi:hypothetical protein
MMSEVQQQLIIPPAPHSYWSSTWKITLAEIILSLPPKKKKRKKGQRKRERGKEGGKE